MTEPTPPRAGTARCPWCSHDLEDPAVDRCPWCGAQLVGDEVSSLPGVTAIDAEAILQARSEAAGRRGRGRLLGWFGGDTGLPPPSPGSLASLAPPSLEVRREMLRLEIEAAEADLRGELTAELVELELERSEAGAGETSDLPPSMAEGAASVADGDDDSPAIDGPAPR